LIFQFQKSPGCREVQGDDWAGVGWSAVLKDLPGLEEVLKDLLKDCVKRSPPAGGISWVLKDVKEC
jgi:hypothetical protein